MKKLLYVGVDVHKNSIDITLAEEGTGEVRHYGKISGAVGALDTVIRKLTATGHQPCFAYEAGPGGFCVYRHLQKQGLACMVVAPSLIPKQAGNKIKTDRRDSIMLARLFRAGELTSIRVPDEEDEAVRDLFRSRGDAKGVERKTRQQLQAFLLRNGKVFPGRTTWSKTHYKWLSELSLESPIQQIVLQEYVDGEKQAGDRVKRISDQIVNAIPTWKRAQEVKVYQAFRGVSLLTAVGIAAEVGDMQRFKGAKHFMAFLGLVPSEHSSGASVRRGGITKAGNSNVRRLLIEAAWSYRLKARKSPLLLKRQQNLPDDVLALSWKAQLRLCGRYQRLSAKGKCKQKVVASVARELAGFLWAVGKCVVPVVNTEYCHC